MIQSRKKLEKRVDKGVGLTNHMRLSMRTDSEVNDWIMLTNTPKVFVSSPLKGLLRDQLLTFGVFPGQ